MIGTQLGDYRIERLPRGGGADLAADMKLGRPVDARARSAVWRSMAAAPSRPSSVLVSWVGR
jgi:hypothetical protein